MARIATTGLKIAAGYLAASAASLLYSRWPHYEGHAHVPFSAFPEFLAWSPVAPYFLFQEFLEDAAKGLPGLLVFGTVLAGALWVLFRRKRTA